MLHAMKARERKRDSPGQVVEKRRGDGSRHTFVNCAVEGHWFRKHRIVNGRMRADAQLD